MPYMQVRDILKRACAYHARLADAYRWIEKRTPDDQKKRFLEYMATQEDDSRRMLLDYIRTSQSHALETWLHFIPPTTMELGDMPTPDMDLEELVGAAVRLDRSLVGMYDRLATYTSAPGTQEALERLRDLQREKERKFSKAAFFEDIA